jgi:hypothetical protein
MAPSRDDQLDLVEHLMGYHPPRRPETAALLGELREKFADLGFVVVSATQVSPEQTIAIRKLHEALMATTAAVVLHQEDQ